MNAIKGAVAASDFLKAEAVIVHNLEEEKVVEYFYFRHFFKPIGNGLYKILTFGELPAEVQEQIRRINDIK